MIKKEYEQNVRTPFFIGIAYFGPKKTAPRKGDERNIYG